MAKKHFSLPARVLDWLKTRADENGMAHSQYLAHLLMKLMEEEDRAARGRQ